MKRMISMVAVVLLLVMALYGESFSLARPINYHHPHQQSGDDHTWGGEQDSGVPVPLRTTGGGSDITITGIVPLDIFFSTVFMEWLYGDLFSKKQAQPTKYYIITNDRQNDETPNSNSNNKGN